MPERHFYRFPSVDFFGKSMPGILFTLLAIPILPETLFSEIVGSIEQVTLALVVVGIFLIIVVGFSIGQGLNTVSIIFERIVYTVGLIISNKSQLEVDYQRWGDRDQQDEVNSINWIRNQFESFKRIFVPHRILFNDWIRRHLADDHPSHQHKIALFRDTYEEYGGKLGRNLPKLPHSGESTTDIHIPNDIYILVSDYLTHKGVNRARRHKSLFVFCRNAAVTTGYFTFIYGLVLYDVNNDDFILLNRENDTVLAHLFADGLIDPGYPIIIVLATTSVIFLYGISIYKRLYVEYMIVDFINNISFNEN